MSDDVEQAMDRVLGGPTTCPHGNPIPGSDYHAPDATRLVDVEVGTAFTVSRIPEELEFTPGPARLPGVVVDPARSLGPGHRGLAGRHDDRRDRRPPRRRRQLRQRPHPRHRLSVLVAVLRYASRLLALRSAVRWPRRARPATRAAAARGRAPGRSGGWSRAASPASRRAPPPTPGCRRAARAVAVVTHLDAQRDAPVQPGDGLVLDRQVQLELLGHRLAHPHREQPLHVGRPVEVEDALDDALGVLHLVDRLVADAASARRR